MEEQIASGLISYGFAKRNGVLAASDRHDNLTLYVESSQPGYLDAIKEARRLLDRPASIEELTPEAFQLTLNRLYDHGSDSDDSGRLDIALDYDSDSADLPPEQDLLDAEDNAPIIRLINAVLRMAQTLDASDIHIEPFERNMRVRVRVDGIMQEIYTTQAVIAPMVASRIKIMARLDIAEKRLPQDGRFSFHLGGKAVDVRVSTLPGPFGERVVLRLLDKQAGRFMLDQLGLHPDQLRDTHSMLAKKGGIILVTGATGSGKTTTLYSMLDAIRDDSHNILTVEDPIEYDLEGVGQTQVHSKIGMSFARSLRAILRQDPDVVMVGEIRDVETAEVAVQASLTGHLVLSTLHTNSAIGAVTRLKDMGIEPYLLSATLSGLIAQRLVRTLCPDCKTEAPVTELGRQTFETVGDHAIPEKLMQAVGCEKCLHTGYRGRVGIYEVVIIDEELQQAIHDDISEKNLEEIARKHSWNLNKSCLSLLRRGVISSEEAARAIQGL